MHRLDVSPPAFTTEQWVEVRFPLNAEQEAGDREAWPWVPGWIVQVCGPDEWLVCAQHPALAVAEHGQNTYPTCYRDASELREAGSDITDEWSEGESNAYQAACEGLEE